MAEFPPVLSKTDFVRRFVAGEFGNKGPNWKTVEEFIASGYKGLVHLRHKSVGGGGFYNLSPDLAVRHWRLMPEGTFYLAGMAPHNKNLIQGEVALLPDYQLRYSTAVGLPMRDALADHQQFAKGIMAVSLLRHFLCPNSFDWLQLLFDRYPEHIVEFSTFSCNWGTLPHYNTVFWEVRKGY